MMKLKLATLLLFASSVSSAMAVSLSVAPIRPVPDPQVWAAWLACPFEADEIWPVDDEAAFFETLRNAGLSSPLETKLADHLTTGMGVNPSTFRDVQCHYASSLSDSYIAVPSELKRELPKAVLQAAYQFLLDSDHPPPGLLFQDWAEVKREVSDSRLWDEIYEIDGAILLFFTPANWRFLPSHFKEAYLERKTSGGSFQEGLDVYLQFSREDDLHALAEKYAGDRDPRVLQRYFMRLLRRRGRVSIPLVSVLPPFIRKFYNTFPLCSGPNCFNAALAINADRTYPQEFASSFRLKEELLLAYQRIPNSNSLRVGDLLLYRKENVNVHVATYLGDNLVFTKNGIKKFNPYVIDYKNELEKKYFADGNFDLQVYRPLRSIMARCLERLQR